MNPLLNIALKAARKAGDILLQAMERLDSLQVTEKGLHDFVTDLDRRSEKEIITILQKAYPNHSIISEETGKKPGDNDFVWIIDPLDGTHNYLRGYPHFSISIGFKQKGKLQHGLVYDPIRQELFTASRGEGARLNERRIRASTTSRLENALLGTGFPVRHPELLSNYLQSFNNLLPKIANIRTSGSAALDLCYVAAGRLDGFFEIDLKAWDLAAGAIIVKEAGGLVGDWQGKEDYLEKGAIIAATPKIFSLLFPILNSKAD